MAVESTTACWKATVDFLYEHRNHLCQRVRMTDSTKYLKCKVVGRDGSAKLV